MDRADDNMMLQNLFGKVSHFAIYKIKQQMKGARYMKEDRSKQKEPLVDDECTCAKKYNFGLLCRHDLIDRTEPIELSEISNRWILNSQESKSEIKPFVVYNRTYYESIQN